MQQASYILIKHPHTPQ